MKFFIYFLLFMFLSFLVWVGVVFGQVGNPTKTSQWIFDAYEKKYEIAKSIKKRKIIVVAGSNALFGVDSKMLRRAFGMPVVNYGVNAGIELPLTLFLAKRVINKGDIIISPLEYPMYSYDGTAGVQMIDYILSREISLFWRLSLYEQFYILWHVSMKRVWDGYFNQSKTKVTKGLYGAHHIDENGDQINTQVKYRSAWMFGEVINNYAKKPEKYGEEFDKGAMGWGYLDNFVQWCKKRDVSIVFIPSTLLKDKSYFNDEKEKWFYENISKEVRDRGWDFVGNPYSFMYDKSLYFNTNFHLIEKAKDIRTKQIIEDLKKSSIVKNLLP